MRTAALKDRLVTKTWKWEAREKEREKKKESQRIRCVSNWLIKSRARIKNVRKKRAILILLSVFRYIFLICARERERAREDNTYWCICMDASRVRVYVQCSSSRRAMRWFVVVCVIYNRQGKLITRRFSREMRADMSYTRTALDWFFFVYIEFVTMVRLYWHTQPQLRQTASGLVKNVSGAGLHQQQQRWKQRKPRLNICVTMYGGSAYEQFKRG